MEAERSRVWHGDETRLDRVLTDLGMARSRTQAGELIATGRVRIGERAVTKPAQRVGAGSRITAPVPLRFVSRAAHKLIAALDEFGIDPEGRVALDLGASTGGFTQVLLERGARLVQAIDVGHDQIDERVREDPRVRVVERCNARDLTPDLLAMLTGVSERPSLVVADLSFISLTLVLPAIERCLAQDSELVLLIKPQFEVGRVRDGVVVRADQRAEAIRTVLNAAAAHGFDCRGLDRSPILGGRGNVEFVAAFSAGGEEPRDPTEWEGRITKLSADAPVAR